MNKNSNINSLKPFYEARSVAIIGTSRRPGKGGYNIIENLQRLNYLGKIFPINPRADKILGLPVYPDVMHLPEIPDLALIILPPSQVLLAFEECMATGVKAVIIESAGFSEMDEAGASIQEHIARLAKQSGARVMGPNSVGTMNPSANLDTSLGRLNKTFLPDDDIQNGTVTFIGQTGLFTGVYLPLMNREIGIRFVACLGNKCDVDESDMLEYAGVDSQTKVIAMYLESIKDGRRFLKLSSEIIREKPIVIIKSAVTENGAGASVSHTGSIAGEDKVYDTAFRQAGIIRVTGFNQLWDVAKAFVHMPLPKGNRVGIINLSGSGCVTAVDACVRNGLVIGELSAATKNKIKTVYPEWWQVRSPVDVWTAIEASGFEETYTVTIRALLADEGIDAAIIISGAVNWIPGKEVTEIFKSIKTEFPDKPVLVVTPLGDREIFLKMHQGFQSLGIPSYTSDEEAVLSLAALNKYRESKDGLL